MKIVVKLRRAFGVLTLFCGLAAMLPMLSAQTVYNVRSYGATGNGTALDTSAIQSAVNAANARGGGIVSFPPGNYKMGGGITLTNNITVVLTNGAFLFASTNQSDWGSSAPNKIFYAAGSHNLAIVGADGYGAMDGGGLFFYQGDPGSTISGDKLQHMIEFHFCTNLTLANLHLQNSCVQTITFNDCSNIVVTSVTVTNRPREFGSGTDGIDFSDCGYVTVSNMNIETGDDGICVKTENGGAGAHDILVQDCTVATTTMATKFGTATFSPAYNVIFTNITINRHSGIVIGTNNPLPDGRCEAAINVCMCNGGFNHDIIFTHYTINDCSIPIYMEVNDRSGNGFGISSNILFADINCLNASNACQFNVQAGATNNLAEITISNLIVHNFETYSGIDSPPYQDDGYPYGYKIGSTVIHMPAYGLFARYVNGLHFTGNNQFFDDGGSSRPNAIVLENCSNVTTNLTPPAPDFLIGATPVSQPITAGSSATYTNTVTALNNFTRTVNFTVSGLPANTTPSFNPASLNTSGASTLTVATATNTPGGTYTLTITGTNGNLLHSTNVTLTVNPPGGGPPSGWIDVDIGVTPVAGSAAVTNGVWTIRGSGNDIWSSSDNFNFACEPVRGDATLVARVVSLQNTAAAAKAGLMFRETTNANAANVLLCIEAAKGIDMARRLTTGGSTAKVANPAGSAPYWLKLVRSGNSFTGYVSADGTSWTLVGTTNVTMAANAWAGLAVTPATNSATLNTALFDNVSFPDAPVPGFSSIVLDPQLLNMVLSGTNGAALNTFRVLSSASLALPLNDWKVIATNQFGANGNFSITNPINPGVPAAFFEVVWP